jgi:RimJ/RimL family protein N-acetyltransferase
MSASVPASPLNPPYTLRSPQLLLRCLQPEDVPLRKETMDSSAEHLSRLFPEPLPLDAHAAIVRKLRSGFDLDGDRVYGAFHPQSGRMLGEACLLRRVGIDALEIGYWLRHDATGQGLATEMVSAMVKTAFEFDKIKRLDLFCSPDNERSAAMARRLGFTLEGRLRDRQFAPHHLREDVLCFSLLASEYPLSPASRLPLQAFDFLGRRLT